MRIRRATKKANIWTNRLKNCRAMMIHDIFVLEKYRNLGLGSKLLEEVLKLGKSKGVKIFELYSDVGNKIAKRLWRRYGFKECCIGFRKVVK